MLKRLNKFIKYEILKRPYKLSKGISVGRGKPVLLIHGLATSSDTWLPLTQQIDRKKWRLVGYDLLGFGKSPKPTNRSYDVEEHARSIIASMDLRTKNRKIIIVAHSMGCLVATHIATKYPRMVDHLILYEPPLFADSPEFRSHAMRKKLLFTFYASLLNRPRLIFQYSKFASKYLKTISIDVNSKSWLPFEKSLKNTIMKQKSYDELKAVGVPTDIIYGKFDFMVTRSDVKKMLQDNPNITFHLLNEMHGVNPRATRFIMRLLKPL